MISRCTRLAALVATLCLPLADARQSGVDLSALPVLEATAPPAADYLIDPAPFAARALRSADGRDLVLDNGLVRRTWRLGETAACIAFDNLMTGEAVLRAVRPEALVTLSGVEHAVGGLDGQPNHAFLTPDWLETMAPAPGAMRLVGVEIGEPVERFAWKRRRHAAPDATWPPPGVSVRFDFEPGDTVVDARELPSTVAREALIEDDLSVANDAWRRYESDAHPRISFENEGKFGEIYAPGNAHCFAERDLPGGTALVQVVVDSGTDRSASFGPGLGLVFEGGVVEVNLRPGDRGQHGHFELRDRGSESLASLPSVAADDGGLDTSRPYLLIARIEGRRLFLETVAAAMTVPLFEVDASELGALRAARIGKTDRAGGASDGPGETPEFGRCRLRSFGVYGAVDPAVLAEQLEAAQRVRDRLREGGSPLISVHYELYDGVPVLSKWLTVENRSDTSPLTVDRFTAEQLAVVEQRSWAPTAGGVAELPPRALHVETDYAFGSFDALNANSAGVRWTADPQYQTQVEWLRDTPCLLEVAPERGPAQLLAPGETFESFRVFELVHDGEDRERRGLAQRRFYRTVAPWVTENPLTHHLLSADPETVLRAIDQAAEVGFEALILSFGSGFDMEDTSPEHLATWRAVADHAEAKGVELGSYSLFSSRFVGAEHMIVSPDGERPTHGQCPAVTSEWGQDWLRRIRAFYAETGFDQFENDGPYPGDVDVTPRPPLQAGIDDSRWVQWRQTAELYRWMRGRGIYINAPDYYYLSGSNKHGMGYRETNWSLPRAHQPIHTRQNIYDGSWEKTPSMGWMHVPLAQYHGGGPAATIEPLDEHRDHYRRMLLSNLGMGVQAHYRGPRLFDTQRTRDMVKECVDWFLRYRGILESDLIHGRRADGRRLDWMLHANPRLAERGMLCVWNPTDRELTETLRVDLYYTGLVDAAEISRADAEPAIMPLRRDGGCDLTVAVPPGGMEWFVIREP